MGLTVLYIAFGVVALWLLSEVLLQYKARLRWRLLAFGGFLGVVAGVLLASVLVIGAGAVAFALGQTYVTLSFRRGFASGWAVKRPERGADDADSGGKKRRRGRADRHEDPEADGFPPSPDAHDDGGAGLPDRSADFGPSGHPGQDDDYDRDDVFTPARPAAAAETTAVYEPQPMPDDTGSYGVYGDGAYAAAQQAQQQPQTGEQTYGYDYPAYQQQGYGYDAGAQQGYANYSDPYIGAQSYGTSYDTGGYPQQQYGQQQGQAHDPYAGGGYDQTPAEGVWVPQQRGDENYGGELPPEQQGYGYDAQQGRQQQQHGAGYDEQQYRF
ncbi:hypothetical protein KUM39_14720 [Streptomyces sp. J2-1]|uniref:SCO2102 family sporulation regulator n=1 Tax=Streptomyces corallincola TaxID=2851888 RepID=UPI001C38ADC9|nr:hypothetical protein [Streptomyces corallincola]MBV2355609.1 hypothetical protein [Streptomyces corallincola]